MEFDRLLVRAAGYLRGEPLAELDELGKDIYHRRLDARVYPMMRQVVRAHQERGHTVVMISSTLTIHAAPVAAALNIPHLICNHFTVDDDGRLTGGVQTPIIWGARKADAAEVFANANNVVLQDSYFYADGYEDLPLMEAVGHPRPVNPRRGLADAAARNGWPILRPAIPRTG